MHLAALDPIDYRGGPLRHPVPVSEQDRALRLMLDYVRDLGMSHGRLVEGVPEDEDTLAVLYPTPETVPLSDPEPEPASAPTAVVDPKPKLQRRSFFRRLSRR